MGLGKNIREKVQAKKMTETIKQYATPGMAAKVQELVEICHQANIGWWVDIHTGMPKPRNHGELIALIHSGALRPWKLIVPKPYGR